MITAHSDFSLTLLPNGEVLATGDATAELYNPATGTWSVTGSPPFSVGGPNAAVLQNGQVLAIGNASCSPGTCSDALYNPSTGSWTTTGPMATFHVDAIPPSLPNAQLLVLGTSFQSAVNH